MKMVKRTTYTYRLVNKGGFAEASRMQIQIAGEASEEAAANEANRLANLRSGWGLRAELEDIKEDMAPAPFEGDFIKEVEGVKPGIAKALLDLYYWHGLYQNHQYWTHGSVATSTQQGGVSRGTRMTNLYKELHAKGLVTDPNEYWVKLTPKGLAVAEAMAVVAEGLGLAK